MSTKNDRTNYHKEWRKKNPKKYARNQYNYWRKRLIELEKEEEQEKKKFIEA